jgi:hypothetical protein
MDYGNGDVTFRCLFWLHDGRDVVEVVAGSTRQRKSRSDVKYFQKPFLPHSTVQLASEEQFDQARFSRPMIW